MGFDPEFPIDFDAMARLRTWNALHLLNLESCDVGVSPTAWQRSRHPAIDQPKIELVHVGVDTNLLGPDDLAHLTLPNGVTVKAGQPLITYVARNLEPYRGFHSFMRALERIQQSHKTSHTIIVGGDDVRYGQKPKDAPNWREKMLSQVKLDPACTHILGRVPYETYRKVLQVSAAHVYLTYPFVLSWSMLEAMASGCLVIGSRTPPVQEVIEDRRNGLLVDFFDPRDIHDHVIEALGSPESMVPLRQQGLAQVREQYSLKLGEQAYRRLLKD